MIGYINQIDSLNKLTAQQKQVIAEVTQNTMPLHDRSTICLKKRKTSIKKLR